MWVRAVLWGAALFETAVAAVPQDDSCRRCDTTGRVFGLMPHPEAFIHPTNHPAWTQHKALAVREGRPFPDSPMTDGVRLLKNGVAFAAGM